MAAPMSAVQFVDLLEKWDIPFGYYNKNWATHNRNKKGKWGGVNGVMMHHTGSDVQTTMPATLWNGTGDLPGPLCHAGIDSKGKLWLTGWGRCNHAGGGDPDVLEKVISEDYSGILKPKYTNTSSNAIDGNAHFYGFEIMYSGSHAMSIAQMVSSTKVAAAICTHHKWGKRSIIAHGEWQKGKWDPGISPGKMMDINAFRDAADVKIKAGPNPPPTRVLRSFTIGKGDSLYRIARDHLGDGKRWPEIVEANPKLFPLTLVPGSVIKIPKA